MKHFFIALLLALVCLLSWVYVKRPLEWQEWKLMVQKEFVIATGGERALIEEKLFLSRRDLLLNKYDGVEKEYEEEKSLLEEQYGEAKDTLEEQGVDESLIESEVVKFKEKIEEKRVLFEKRKAEIEEQIAHIKAQYEETKRTLQELNDSVQKMREGAKESADAIGELRDIVRPE